MGYLDTENKLSSSQALTGTGTTAAINVIDLGQSNRRIGNGESLVVVVSLDVAAGGTTPTMAFALKLDNTNGATTTVFTSQTYAAASLTAGARFYVPVPPGLSGRYLGLAYTLGGTSPTATVTAVLQSEDAVSSNPTVYASGFSVY